MGPIVNLIFIFMAVAWALLKVFWVILELAHQALLRFIVQSRYNRANRKLKVVEDPDNPDCYFVETLDGVEPKRRYYLEQIERLHIFTNQTGVARARSPSGPRSLPLP